MKKLRVLVLGLVIYAHILFASSLQEIDNIAVIVNNDIILASDINKLFQSIKFNAQQDHQSLPDDKLLYYQVMEHLIMNNLQLQIAQNIGITISDSDLDEVITNIAVQNKMTLNEFRNRLSYENLDYNTYRSQIRKEMLISEVHNNEVRRRVIILPQEVDALTSQMFEQNANDIEMNISHIFLSFPDNPSKKQIDIIEKLAKKLIEKLHSGTSFEKLAITYSSSSEALNGGKMGWSKLKDMPTLFAEHLMNAKKDIVVGPIRSDVGFHLLKVNDIYFGSQSLFVSKFHIRHILIKPSAIMTDDQVRIKLETLAKDIKNNHITFNDAAKNLSQDSSSAVNGGDLGWVSASIFDTTFRDILMKLNKGEISPPIKSVFGWHLIQLLDARQEDKTDAEKKSRAYQILFNRKFSEETQIWMQELRAKAYVKIING